MSRQWTGWLAGLLGLGMVLAAGMMDVRAAAPPARRDSLGPREAKQFERLTTRANAQAGR